jgi:hypothetical protein
VAVPGDEGPLVQQPQRPQLGRGHGSSPPFLDHLDQLRGVCAGAARAVGAWVLGLSGFGGD